MNLCGVRSGKRTVGLSCSPVVGVVPMISFLMKTTKKGNRKFWYLSETDTFCTIAVFSLYGEYVVRFFLPNGVFLPCDHGLDF